MSTYFRFPRRGRDRFQRFDITVIFLDIIGFTRGTTNDEMTEYIDTLRNGIDQTFTKFKWDEDRTDNELILIPTGDGYAICFCPAFTDDEVLEYAVRLHKRLTTKMQIRIGINKGPVMVFEDLNGHLNVMGWGINYAQRIMAIAEENQILCSSDFVDPLLKEKRIENLVDFGEYPIKHGDSIGVFNYCKNREFGNAKQPEK